MSHKENNTGKPNGGISQPRQNPRQNNRNNPRINNVQRVIIRDRKGQHRAKR